MSGRWALVALAVAVSIAALIAVAWLWWRAPIAMLVGAAIFALAVVQIWRRAGRVIPTGGEQ